MFDPTLDLAFWTIIKYGLLSVLFLYMIFAAIVIKQISIMIQTVKMGFEGAIRVIGIVHFIVAVAVFIISLLYL